MNVTTVTLESKYKSGLSWRVLSMLDHHNLNRRECYEIFKRNKIKASVSEFLKKHKECFIDYNESDSFNFKKREENILKLDEILSILQRNWILNEIID